MLDAPSRSQTTIKVALNLVPYVGGALATIYEDWLSRRRASVERVAEVTLANYGKSDEEFVRRLREDVRLASLFVTALEAAAATAVEAKVTALGLLLADAASTTHARTFDEKELMVLALADLEWPHVRALRELAEYPSDAELYAELRSENVNAVNEDPRRRERIQLVESLPRPVVAALVRHGLVSENAGYGLYVEGTTPFGRALLDYLERKPDPSEPRTG
jgi:hypothetical protein